MCGGPITGEVFLKMAFTWSREQRNVIGEELLTGVCDETSELSLVNSLGKIKEGGGLSNVEKWKHRVYTGFAIKLPNRRTHRLPIRDYRQVLMIVDCSECTMSHDDRLG